MILVWLGLLFAFIIIEAVTLALVSIWAAVGSLVALVLAYFGASLIVQIFAFMVTTGLTLYYFLSNKSSFIKPKRVKTNLDSVIGEEGLVKVEITKNKPGIVYIQGKEWTAISSNGKEIQEGTTVRVREIQGVKLVVK